MRCNKNNFIKKLRKRDEKALEFVVGEYFPFVKTIVHKVLNPLGKSGIAEECISDVFLAIWDNFDKFNGDDEMEFKKWLYKVSKFRAIDYYRKEVKFKEVEMTEEAVGETVSAEAEVIKAESQEELIKLINTLDTLDQDIFMMKYFLGMKSEEIGQKMGLTRTSVDNRVYRGKKKLVKEVNELKWEVI